MTGTLLACVLLLLGACTSGRGPADTTRVETIELRVHRLINEARADRGLPRLTRFDALDEEARRHSLAMANGRVRFSHRGFEDRAARIRAVAAVTSVGENLSQTRGHGDPAAVAVEQWLASRGHRRNLMGDYELTGVGAAEARDGTVFVTQLFANQVAVP